MRYRFHTPDGARAIRVTKGCARSIPRDKIKESRSPLVDVTRRETRNTTESPNDAGKSGGGVNDEDVDVVVVVVGAMAVR